MPKTYVLPIVRSSSRLYRWVRLGRHVFPNAIRWTLRSLAASALMAGSLDAGSVISQTETNEEKVDKSRYHLFNATPREFMREMSTDRPDTTESPITVDAGHVQIEASIIDYGREKRFGIEGEVYTYGAMNVKVGLLNNVDVQFVFDLYSEVRTRDTVARVSETVSGFSDLQARLKINLWGNEGGRTALAFFPFIKIPTGSDLSNDKVEGGIILPFAMELTDRLGLGLMLETDFVYDEESGSYETEFVHSAVLGYGITEKLGAFIEYVGVAGSSDFEYLATLVGGFTYAVTEDLQVDAGVRYGMNEPAEDFGVFTGFSVRF